MTEYEWEPFRAVLDLALDRLILTLKDAQVYLGVGDGPRAIAALDQLGELQADLEAALRLFKNRNWRGP